MNEQLRNTLTAAGVDVEDIMNRLMGNMTLISRFFGRFPEDKNYGALVENLENNNCEEAFRAAHTLKGVCANLSMTELAKIVSRQTEYLRDGDLKKAKELMPELSKEYEDMVRVIKGIQW